MLNANAKSSRNLMQLCIAYFLSYVATGVGVKYFLGKPDLGFPGMHDLELLFYSSLGSIPFVTLFVLAKKWYKLESEHKINLAGFKISAELPYIILSGICTGIIIPTTTLMYTLPISVMVAMVIMRGSVIIISRMIDAIQIKQGILHKKVYAEENIAVLFSVLAVGVHTFWAADGSFDFLKSTAAMSILGSYILAYFIRIYIMNYYKNTGGEKVHRDNRVFFGIEQIVAFFTMLIAILIVFNSPSLFNWHVPQIEVFRNGIISPKPLWIWAVVLAGMPFGLVSFFSVFIFMYKGRTATFTGLVNRLTSLIAGTAATLIFHYAFGGKFPKFEDWLSLVFIVVAIAFLTGAEKKRAQELVRLHEMEAENDVPVTDAQTAAA
jgi:hypothetical protein